MGPPAEVSKISGVPEEFKCIDGETIAAAKNLETVIIDSNGNN